MVWYFIDGFIANKKDSSYYFHFNYFSFAKIYVQAITPEPYGLDSWIFTVECILSRRCIRNKKEDYCFLYPPPQLCLWGGGGILFSHCPSVCPSEHTNSWIFTDEYILSRWCVRNKKEDYCFFISPPPRKLCLWGEPPQTVFVGGGILFSRCPSVRPNILTAGHLSG